MAQGNFNVMRIRCDFFPHNPCVASMLDKKSRRDRSYQCHCRVLCFIYCAFHQLDVPRWFFIKMLLLKLLQRNLAQNHSQFFILLLSKERPFDHESVQRIRQAKHFFIYFTLIIFTVLVSFWMRKMWNSVLCKFNCNIVKSP